MVPAEQRRQTRRALHRAPGPWSTEGGHRARARDGRAAPVALPRTRWLTLRLSFQAVAAATAVAFLSGAVTGVALETAGRQDAAAQAQAQAQRDRADRAATVRLTAAAAQYAAARQGEALAAAQGALVQAQDVLATAPALVGEATVDPLGEAVTQLSALVASAARPALPALPAASADAAVTVVANTEAADTQATPAPRTRGTGALTPPSPAGGDADVAADAARAAAPVATSADPAAEPEAAALALVGVPDDALDLGTSARLLVAAQQVAALSVQVAALSEAVAVELADAEEAAQARRAEQEVRRIAAEQAALQAAVARMSTRIAATDAAPNGEIPVELLCRPRFASILLRCDAATALERLNTAYRAAFGHDLAVSGGYRTLAEQQQARAAKGDMAAQPGTSNHGRALAVDFSDFGAVGQFDDADYLWMVANGPRYGWVHPPAMGPGGNGPLEPWHWEYGDL